MSSELKATANSNVTAPQSAVTYIDSGYRRHFTQALAEYCNCQGSRLRDVVIGNCNHSSFRLGCSATVSLLLLLVFTSSALARPYRCEGRVQPRPCEASVEPIAELHQPAIVQSRRIQVIAPRNDIYNGTALFARIVKQEFLKQRGGDGLWKGIVEGNGEVTLHLIIEKGGIMLSSWKMGSVLLSRSRPSSFAFRTRAPDGGDWKWRVLARAAVPRGVT